MKTYSITLLVILEGIPDEHVSRWCGWTEQVAIAQAFLSYAQRGARELKVLDIIEIN